MAQFRKILLNHGYRIELYRREDGFLFKVIKWFYANGHHSSFKTYYKKNKIKGLQAYASPESNILDCFEFHF